MPVSSWFSHCFFSSLSPIWLRVTTVFVPEIASQDVHIVALQHPTRSPACSSVSSAALRACVCPQALTGTSKRAPATTTGRLRKAAPSVLRETHWLKVTRRKEATCSFMIFLREFLSLESKFHSIQELF